MKGIYAIQFRINKDSPNGIERKIMSQIRCFQANGLECEEVYLPDRRENLSPIISKMFTVLPFTNVGPFWGRAEEFKDASFIYFRRPIVMNYGMRKFLGKMKRDNPNLKVIIEIPTYPYDMEYNTFKLRVMLFKDRYNRRRLNGLVDRFAVISDEKIDELWNVPAISFKNGYEVSSVKPRTRNQDDDRIHLGCVAMFMPWHGYERLLNGLLEYYKSGGTRSVMLHFAGEGEELGRYKEIAEHQLLKDRVAFHGMLTGEMLDNLYNKLDFGVISLSIYKINSQITSALKSREYLARGIPMISGSKVDVITCKNEMPYNIEFSNDSTNIDIQRIIEFYDEKIKPVGSETITREIRDFAFRTIDMNLTFKPIIDYIKS